MIRLHSFLQLRPVSNRTVPLPAFKLSAKSKESHGPVVFAEQVVA